MFFVDCWHCGRHFASKICFRKHLDQGFTVEDHRSSWSIHILKSRWLVWTMSRIHSWFACIHILLDQLLNRWCPVVVVIVSTTAGPSLSRTECDNTYSKYSEENIRTEGALLLCYIQQQRHVNGCRTAAGNKNANTVFTEENRSYKCYS